MGTDFSWEKCCWRAPLASSACLQLSLMPHGPSQPLCIRRHSHRQLGCSAVVVLERRMQACEHPRDGAEKADRVVVVDCRWLDAAWLSFIPSSPVSLHFCEDSRAVRVSCPCAAKSLIVDNRQSQPEIKHRSLTTASSDAPDWKESCYPACNSLRQFYLLLSSLLNTSIVTRSTLTFDPVPLFSLLCAQAAHLVH